MESGTEEFHKYEIPDPNKLCEKYVKMIMCVKLICDKF